MKHGRPSIPRMIFEESVNGSSNAHGESGLDCHYLRNEVSQDLFHVNLVTTYEEHVQLLAFAENDISSDRKRFLSSSEL